MVCTLAALSQRVLHGAESDMEVIKQAGGGEEQQCTDRPAVLADLLVHFVQFVHQWRSRDRLTMASVWPLDRTGSNWTHI